MKEEVRIDKWLWAVRLFKTRSLAADFCKKGKVKIGETTIKPSRNIKVGDVIQLRKGPVTFSFKVLALSENRMNAKLVPEFMENVTTPEELEVLEMARLSGYEARRRGTGRPTKKERRDLDDFMGTDDAPLSFDWDFDSDDEDSNEDE